MSEFSIFMLTALIRRPEELHFWKYWFISTCSLILVTLIAISVHLHSVIFHVLHIYVKSENYSSYVWGITCFVICTITLKGLPCHLARWSVFQNMRRIAMYFYPCSLEHDFCFIFDEYFRVHQIHILPFRFGHFTLVISLWYHRHRHRNWHRDRNAIFCPIF